MNVPGTWKLTEDKGKSVLRITEKDTIEVAFVELAENDPKIEVTDERLKEFLEKNTLAKKVVPLPDRYFLGETKEIQEPAGILYRWSVAKVTDKRHISVLFVTYKPSEQNEAAFHEVLEAVRSARFVAKR